MDITLTRFSSPTLAIISLLNIAVIIIAIVFALRFTQAIMTKGKDGVFINLAKIVVVVTVCFVILTFLNTAACAC